MRVSKEAREIYERTNKDWEDRGFLLNPESCELPQDHHLDFDEAVRFVKYAHAHEGVEIPKRFRRGSGNRMTWPRSGEWTINPVKGWHDLVHMVSHWIWLKKSRTGQHKKRAHHCAEHAALEARLSDQFFRNFKA